MCLLWKRSIYSDALPIFKWNCLFFWSLLLNPTSPALKKAQSDRINLWLNFRDCFHFSLSLYQDCTSFKIYQGHSQISGSGQVLLLWCSAAPSSVLEFVFCFFGRLCCKWKFPGQGLSQQHSSNLTSDDTRSLTVCAIGSYSQSLLKFLGNFQS